MQPTIGTSVRFPGALQPVLERAAKVLKVSISTYIRMATIEKIKLDAQDDPNLDQELTDYREKGGEL